MQSPFKFLDAYTREDRDIFFGRETEIEKLYRMVFESKLVLLYGASGTGKTSLINCGLANEFHEADWFPLFVRRKDHLLQSLNREIRHYAKTPIPEDAPVRRAIKSLFYDHYRPIYLVFDQFEELFILGDEEEQVVFFENLNELLQVRLQCTIIISMREEYIAYLSDYEKVIPSLFDHRLRIEKMKRINLETVIKNTAKAFDIELLRPEVTVGMMLSSLRDKKGVDLTNLQVYMDRLYRVEASRMVTENRDHLCFDPGLIQDVGELQDVLADFLDEQLAVLEKEIGKKGVPMDVLFTLVTDNATRRSASLEMIKASLARRKKIKAEDVEYCVKRFAQMRIFKELDE